MKRSLESLDGNLEFDLPELDSGFLDALLAEDPKKLRQQGGKNFDFEEKLSLNALQPLVAQLCSLLHALHAAKTPLLPMVL